MIVIVWLNVPYENPFLKTETNEVNIFKRNIVLTGPEYYIFFNDKEHKLQTLDKVREFFKSQIGSRTRQALEELSIPFVADDLDRVLIQVEDMVQQKFPGEFKAMQDLSSVVSPQS